MAEKDGVVPLLTSEDYKAIIDLIKKHRQSEKEMHVKSMDMNMEVIIITKGINYG